MSFSLKSPPPDKCLRSLPRELMERYGVFPVELDEETNRLTVAMADVHDFDLIADLQLAAGMAVIPQEASPADIQEWISTFLEKDSSFTAASRLKAASPVIRLVDEILQEAMHTGVSDIHFEPGERAYNIRFRKDGVLHLARKLHVRQAAEITSRLKIMASMDIAEKRRPQDGRIRFDDGSKAVDIRVSALPTDYGQKMVLRLLDKGQIIHKLDSLGMSQGDIEAIEGEIHKPYGMFLITGPTGSGKTTTLYTLLQMIRSPELNISTIEEPIEYKLEGITQTAVNPKIDLTFASALRTLLRQDPDVIMVGEIRDSETAELAIRAALTGHLVFFGIDSFDLLIEDAEGFGIGIRMRVDVRNTIEVPGDSVIHLIADDPVGDPSLVIVCHTLRVVTDCGFAAFCQNIEAICTLCAHTSHRLVRWHHLTGSCTVQDDHRHRLAM